MFIREPFESNGVFINNVTLTEVEKEEKVVFEFCLNFWEFLKV